MRKFSLSVGEPWDFEGPDGQNNIELELLGEVDGPNVENWATSYLLLKVIRPFSFNGEAVECLVAAPRYEGESLRSVFQNGGTVGVGRVDHLNRLVGPVALDGRYRADPIQYLGHELSQLTAL